MFVGRARKQVRFNITKLQEWARENGLDDVGDMFKESVQITQLLQVNKTSVEDVDTILDCCEALNPVQVQKILTMCVVSASCRGGVCVASHRIGGDAGCTTTTVPLVCLLP